MLKKKKKKKYNISSLLDEPFYTKIRRVGLLQLRCFMDHETLVIPKKRQFLRFKT